MLLILPAVVGALLAPIAADAQVVDRDDDAAIADDPLKYAGPPRKQDEVYRISTRHLSEPEDGRPFELELHRWSESDAWEAISLEAFASDQNAQRLTLIYVHGYSFDEEKADRTGWAFYHAVCDDPALDRPVRYVFWSWPTTQKRFRPTRDLADKAQRADVDAFYLAWLLSQLDENEPVCVVGSSLGCRVVQGMLHLAGGGKIGDWTLGARRTELPAKLSAAYISACVHNYWLKDGEFHEKAIAGVDRLLLINNSVDSMLFRYGKVWRSNPVALGLDGVPDAVKLGTKEDRILQYDAHEEIGDRHGVEHYLRNESVVDRLRAFATAE